MYSIFTGKFARIFSKEGRIEEWIHRFLKDEGGNTPLSNGLKIEKRFYVGPLSMPLHTFERCCGPEEEMQYKVDQAGFEERVTKICSRLESGWDMPPLIINYVDGKFMLSDGNHRYEAIIRCGYTTCDVIIWITEQVDYERFIKTYSRYLVN